MLGAQEEKLRLTSKNLVPSHAMGPDLAEWHEGSAGGIPSLRRRRAWRVRLRWILGAFILFLLYLIGRGGSNSRRGGIRSTWRSLFPSAGDTAYVHPITRLMDEAEEEFRTKLARQSKTLEEAVAEYKRRYNRVPPKGFEHWFEFTQEWNITMIDEYDGLMADMEPFWMLSGEEMRRRAEQVSRLPSVDIVRVRNGKLEVPVQPGHEDVARAKGFKRMLERYAFRLPDMDFPINAKAEGRILVPWEHVKYPNTTKQDSSGGINDMLGGEFVEDWRGDGNVWEAFRRTCDPSSQARRLLGSIRNPPSDEVPRNYLKGTSADDLRAAQEFTFAQDVGDRFDFCNHPYAHFQQGHFFSDWRTIPVLYPIFSPAKAPGFLDIRIPSHYYYAPTKRYAYGWNPVTLEWKDIDVMEKPWEEKLDDIFWRGATTGGGSAPPGFSPQYQRHRFLKMTSDKSDLNRTIVFEDPRDPSKYVTAQVPSQKLNEDVMNVGFVNALDHKMFPGGLEAMHKMYRFAESVPLGEHWSHKFLPDIDGMGYSGRFFAFLHSQSAVIKSTVYQEYFSDWIQPWLHFIPLSSGYKELYNIHAYFRGPSAAMLEAANITVPEGYTSDEGDRRLRRIARAGRQWRLTVGRPIEMDAYVYRLVLEYARLWADDREENNYREVL